MSSITWLHCNKCVELKKHPFYLLKCGHILCRKCGERAGQCQRCPICEAPATSFMPLDRNAPPDIAEYFKDDLLEQLVKAHQFQNKQHDLYLEYLKQQVLDGEEKLRKLKAATDAKLKERAELCKELDALRKIETEQQKRASMVRGRRLDASRGSAGSSGITPNNSRGFFFNGLNALNHEVLHSRSNNREVGNLFDPSRADHPMSIDSSTGTIPKRFPTNRRPF